jgi:hypothetical protein
VMTTGVNMQFDRYAGANETSRVFQLIVHRQIEDTGKRYHPLTSREVRAFSRLRKSLRTNIEGLSLCRLHGRRMVARFLRYPFPCSPMMTSYIELTLMVRAIPYA